MHIDILLVVVGLHLQHEFNNKLIPQIWHILNLIPRVQIVVLEYTAEVQEVYRLEQVVELQ